MSEGPLARAMEIVEQALALGSGERDAFLRDRCADDPELLETAKRLLRTASEPVGEGLGRHIEAAVKDAAVAAVGEETTYPDRIGPYTVTGVLGEGGMGVVLAARQEEPVSREVAIKLIRAGAHAPGLVERFRTERQTLAMLEHPDIARLYDAGTTPEGLPYFVMERIRGEPLTEYCDRKRLGLERRLRLFRTLLGAVEHAHQKTIVHRDLKPSNVLVAEIDHKAALKVIDFGIARVASGEPGLTGLTGLGGGMGTLEYMSPEQLLRPGHGADTRSDVYALGVILHQLVTGRLPFDTGRIRTAPPKELERMLVDAPKRHPSRILAEDPDLEELARLRSVEARRLVRRVRGELDTIIETAIAGDPTQRYGSVARLDEDIARFFDGRPISARPRNLPYRTRKLLARNRVAAVTSALAVGLMTAMAITFTFQLADERDRARLEAERAQEIAGFLESLFEVSDPSTPESGEMTARELLDAGAVRIEEELEGRPDLQSSLFAVVGRTYGGLGRWKEADAYLSRALDLERTVSGVRTPEVGDRLEDLGGMLAQAGRLERADSILHEGLALRLQLQGDDHPATATTMAQLAIVRRGLGDYEEAEPLARDAVAILREHSATHGVGLARALHYLAFILRSRGSLDESEDLYREALALRRQLLDPTHPDVLSTMSNLAIVLENRGNYPEAESLLREVVDTRRQRLGAEHPITLGALNNLAYMLWRTGSYPQATELFEDVVALGRRIHGGDNPGLAIMLNNLGVAQRRLGALAEAERTHHAAIAMNRRLFGQEHPRIAGDMDNLGRTLLAQGRAEAAESLHVAALAMRTRLLGEDHPDRAESLAALGESRLALGAHAEGVELMEEAVRIRTTALGSGNARTAQVLHDLGVALLAGGDRSAAERRLREALRARRAALGDGHPDVAATLLTLGRILREDARYEEAEAMLDEARAIALRRLDPSDRQRQRVERELELLVEATTGGFAGPSG